MSIIDIFKPQGGQIMANALSTKTNEMSLEGARKLADSVKEGMALVNKGYLSIAPMVAKLYDCKGFKALGYKNYDEMCALEFGMSHGTATDIRKVFKRFGAVSVQNEYSIPDKYTEYGYTKLLLFASDAQKFENAGINPLEVFTPDMTIKEMRETLKAKLEDKADKQDATATDTTATESTATESTETTESTATESTETSTTELSIRDRLDAVIVEIEAIKKEMNVKPDKDRFDGAIAYLKEMRKLAK